MKIINWITDFFKKKKDWTLIEKNGSKTLISPEVMEFYNSKLPSPKPLDLEKLIEKTDKVTISERSIKNGKIEYPIVYSTNTKQDIKTIGKKLEIKTDLFGHILDGGDFFFNFITKDGKKHQIEYIAKTHIRWKEKWKDDAELKDHVALLEWFNNLGIEKPLIEYNEALIREEKYQIEFKNWTDKSPQAIINAINNDYIFDYDKIYSELIKEIPNENDLILEMYNLYGCGFTSWNGFPVIELIPHEVLLKFETKKLLKVDNISNLSEEQKHGMARFFSSGDFYRKTKNEIVKLPTDLVQAILDHLLELGDNEKTNSFKEFSKN